MKSIPNKLAGLDNEIIEKYNNKIPVSQIATEYEVHISAIYKLLKKNKQETRNPSDEARKYKVNENYFDIIDSEHKAYWLGFLYADGYVSSTRNDVRLQLEISDKYIIEKFISDLESDYPIMEYVQNRITPSGTNPKSKMASVSFRSAKLKNDLIKHGCIPRKSLVLNFPNTIRKDLIRHFIRGYIDGDGCITRSKVQKCGNKSFELKICGTNDLLNGIFDYFESLTSITRTLYKRFKDNKNNYSIQIAGNLKVRTILDNLYENSTIYLDRKYKRYLELKQQADRNRDIVG